MSKVVFAETEFPNSTMLGGLIETVGGKIIAVKESMNEETKRQMKEFLKKKFDEGEKEHLIYSYNQNDWEDSNEKVQEETSSD